MSTETTQRRSEQRRPVAQQSAPGQLNPGDDIVTYLRTYARERPDVAAMWCFGIGFVLGWKLKPW